MSTPSPKSMHSTTVWTNSPRTDYRSLQNKLLGTGARAAANSDSESESGSDRSESQRELRRRLRTSQKEEQRLRAQWRANMRELGRSEATREQLVRRSVELEDENGRLRAANAEGEAALNGIEESMSSSFVAAEEQQADAAGLRALGLERELGKATQRMQRAEEMATLARAENQTLQQQQQHAAERETRAHAELHTARVVAAEQLAHEQARSAGALRAAEAEHDAKLLEAEVALYKAEAWLEQEGALRNSIHLSAAEAASHVQGADLTALSGAYGAEEPAAQRAGRLWPQQSPQPLSRSRSDGDDDEQGEAGAEEYAAAAAARARDEDRLERLLPELENKALAAAIRQCADASGLFLSY